MLFRPCCEEIVDLHRFFTAWFSGEAPREEAHLSRLTNALAPGFHLLDPEGRIRSRQSVIEGVRSAHATDPRFEIRIEALERRFETEDLCLVTYQEWQLETDQDWRGRLSTAWFRRAPDAPRGFVWLHLHETWLPDEASPPS